MSERFDTFSPWQPTPVEVEATAEEDEGTLEPREAAALLERTRAEAERRFELRPVWLVLFAAVVVLVCYGAVWLSVRGQHPYRGPAGWALGTLYGTLAVWAVLNSIVLGRATRGVGGRAARRRTVDGAVFATIWICVYVIQGALSHAGVSKGFAYGIWPAAGPLILVGAAAAGYEAAREKPATAGFAAATVVLASSACFAGPAGVWGVIAVGFSTLLLVSGAGEFWRRRLR